MLSWGGLDRIRMVRGFGKHGTISFPKNLPLPPRHVHKQISANVDGGPNGGSSVRRPVREDPNRPGVNQIAKFHFHSGPTFEEII